MRVQITVIFVILSVVHVEESKLLCMLRYHMALHSQYITVGWPEDLMVLFYGMLFFRQ